MNSSVTNNFEQGTSLPSSQRCLVLAQPSVLRAIADGPDKAFLDLAELRPLEPAERLPGDVVARATCIFVEVVPGVQGSITRIEDLRRQNPSLVIVAIMERPELSMVRALMRLGVHDVISLPLQPAEVASILLDVGAKMPVARADLAPMVALASPTGGGGATTLITHLGAALAKAAPAKSCCIIDLDLQFGDTANYLGLTAKSSVVDLIEAGDRLDKLMVRDSAISSGRGPNVITAPADMNPIEDLALENLQRLLRICRAEFDLVLLDLPSNWTNWVVSTIVDCDQLVVLTETSLHSIRRTRRCLDLFDMVGIPRGRASLVVNRVERKLLRQIDVNDVADTLQRPILASIPLEGAMLSKAQDQGMLIGEMSRKTHFETAMDEFANNLLAKMSEHPA